VRYGGYGDMLQAANILIWDWDARRTDVFLGGSWSIILKVGKETSALTVDQLARMVHPDDLPNVKHTLANCLKGKESEYTAEYRIKTLAGGWVWSLSRGRVVERDAAGRCVRMTGSTSTSTIASAPRSSSWRRCGAKSCRR
jgi:PAS domain-containing protein